MITLAIGIGIGFGIAQLVGSDTAIEPSKDDQQAARDESADLEPLSGLGAKNGDTASARDRKPDRKSLEDLEELFLNPVARSERIDAYLHGHGYSKEALLAAIQLDPDNKRHLLEAAKRFPDDPHIQFLVITHKALPDERSEWVERFKKSQPDNAYASLLYGTDLMGQGKTEEALAQLRLAGSQEQVDDFSRESWLAGDSAMIEVGFDPLQAKIKTTFGQTLPFFSDFQTMLRSLQGIAEEASGPAERVEIATIGAALGNQFTQGEGNATVIHRLVGIAAEKRFLGMLEPDVTSPGFAETPAVMLEQLESEQAEIREISKYAERIQTQFSPAELEHYLDRVRFQGELEAMRWARPRLED